MGRDEGTLFDDARDAVGLVIRATEARRIAGVVVLRSHIHDFYVPGRIRPVDVLFVDDREPLVLSLLSLLLRWRGRLFRRQRSHLLRMLLWT